MARLLPGMTYAHEHVIIDLSGVKKDADCRLDVLADTVAELTALKALGVSNMVDVTNRGMGRNARYALKVQELSGMNLLLSTGYYKEPFLPPEVYELSEQELAKIMVDEIRDGIDDTGLQAAVIGEVGTSKDAITTVEKKLLGAAARAQVETGRPLSTHTTMGCLGSEQLDLLAGYGVDLGRVVIGHVDLTGDLDYILRLIDRGAYVAFDTVGKNNYYPDQGRAELLGEISRRGLAGRVLLSMDITRKSHLRKNGGLGYRYLVESFVPLLQAQGIPAADVARLLTGNPVDFFTYQKV